MVYDGFDKYTEFYYFQEIFLWKMNDHTTTNDRSSVHLVRIWEGRNWFLMEIAGG